ncbi:hypothetical protein G3P90_002112 [Escherichia coli]|nr:hypothetical protein [Escherichia coli]EMW56034.1 hypothetical protein EC2756500_4648 [Escherichia coli 2756500]EFI3424167.1 hypothetical protein [Escherichia coli]EFI3666485.1 hypothetical protein [Escherichia coli]EFI4011212.1 hypothetical protein [Escherichia coli]
MVWKALYKRTQYLLGSFFSINAISREIYHQSLMCDFLFIVEPGLFIIGLNKVNG